MMRIITLNVNGIRSAHAKGFWDWAMQQNADVICLQEIKAHTDVIPEACRAPASYHAYFHPAERPGYSGVAIYTKHKPDAVKIGLGWPEIDAEGRYLQIDIGKLSIVSLYLPSGSSSETRQGVKFQFLERFAKHLLELKHMDREFVLCGDFNIAHRAIDLENWKSNQKNSGFLPEERAWMDWLLEEAGYVDAFRTLNPNPKQYTWWSNRGRAYEKNVGWRIDYHIVSSGLQSRLVDAQIFKDIKFSDHAPLTIDYQLDPRSL